MYKMVFLDVDGTILTSKGVLDTKISKIAKKLKEKGILIGLATGRSPSGAKLYGDLLEIKYYVTYNGALVMDGDKTIFDKQLSADVAQKLCEKTAAMGGTYVHFQYDFTRSNNPNHNIEHLLPKAIFSPASKMNLGAHRIALYLDTLEQNKIKSEIGEALFFDEQDRLEVYPPTVSKWLGIEQIINTIGVKPEEVVTIGDGTNDLEMLQFAGLGVAMGNAPKYIKETAKWVTKDNDHHGASYALMKIFGL
jgi:5-amino-6-(5-phospho-D-ribitylamino)uracil phosphatase